jgi:hypothetical protein
MTSRPFCLHSSLMIKSKKMSSLMTVQYRYEKKFKIDDIGYQQVLNAIRVHPGMFIKHYPDRYVNNIYMDTLSYDSFYSSIEGVAERKKVRIRWYGEISGFVKSPTLEIKRRNGSVGDKLQYSLPSLSVDNSLSTGHLFAVIRDSTAPENLKASIANYHCTLINRYHRRYFISVDKRYRLTLDNKLSYFLVRKGFHWSFYNMTDSESIICEVKYSCQNDSDSHNLCSEFPFRISKSSKYVDGLLNFDFGNS